MIYNCGLPVGDVRDDGYGVVLKGNGHRLYQNTVFNLLTGAASLPSCPEPYKPWAHQEPLDPHQNNRSQVFNLAVTAVINGNSSCNSSTIRAPGGNETGILHSTLQAMQLRDAAGFDFRPLPTSPLVQPGAGVVFPPYADGTFVGAYPADGPLWVPGCTFDKQCGPSYSGR